jgi:hypothetical protein
MSRPVDISMQRFGALVAQTRLIGSKRTLWQCSCDCGKTVTVPYGNLRSGNTTSCGCLKYANRKTGRVTKASFPEYKIWGGIRQRCLNPNDPGYHRYGGRGITICDRWSVFENFLTDMGPRPSPDHSIDRKDNDGPYSPDNCQWATIRVQTRNRRANVRVTAFGRTQVLKDWAHEVGINYQTISARLNAGWPIETALTAPRKKGPRRELNLV